MKPDKTVALIFTAVNIILVIICTIFYLGTDRKSPEFKFQVSGLTWREDIDQTRFLENVTAYDSKEGDVTDRIVIEKIVENKAESAAIVFYAVCDKAGNVTKISRVFPAEFAADDIAARQQEPAAPIISVPVNPESESADSGNADAENAEIENTDSENTDSENADSENTDSEDVDSENADSDDTDTDDTDSENPVAENADSENMGAENTDSGNTQPENNNAEGRASNAASEEIKGEKPFISLKTSEVTTSAGTAPAWVEVIGELSDDKDSYEDLFHNLSVSKYDVNKAGAHKVALSTKDSDGNSSEPVTLTIHVK